jgi:hypothetical protein
MSEDGKDIRAFLAQAAHARGHAKWLTDARAAHALREYADELEAKAETLRKERAQPTLPEKAANAPAGEPEIGPDLIAVTKSPELSQGEAEAQRRNATAPCSTNASFG